ncbi:MAG: hypothetical protein ACOVK2_07385 [Candidatus Fonsibacter sp.]
MEEEIENILTQYYSNNNPVISDLQILDASPASGIFCIRWRANDVTITIKSIKNKDTYIITQLQ